MVLLAPGLAFVLRRERVVPAQDESAFRESLRVIFVSVLCVTVTGLLAAGIRALYPQATPDFGALVRSPAGFARAHYVQLTWWALAMVAFSTLIAAVAADPRIARKVRRAGRSRVARWLTGSTYAAITPTAALYGLVHMFDHTEAGRGPVYVSATMADGTLVHGSLHSYDVGTAQEQADIVVSKPRLTTKDGKTHEYGAQFAVLSARNVTRLDLTHLAPVMPATPAATRRRPWRGLLEPDP